MTGAMSAARMERLARDGQTFMWHLIGLMVIVGTLGTLLALHAQLGGWSTRGGAFAGLTFLFLFWGPLIDRAIVRIPRVASNQWAKTAGSVLGLIGLVVTACSMLMLLVTAWTEQSWTPVAEALRELLSALSP